MISRLINLTVNKLTFAATNNLRCGYFVCSITELEVPRVFVHSALDGDLSLVYRENIHLLHLAYLYSAEHTTVYQVHNLR